MKVIKKEKQRFPNRKISETFIDFALPLIELAEPNATKDDIEQILKIAFTVWNAVVYDTVNGNDQYLTSIRQLTAGDSFASATVEQMLSRKKSEFGNDQRLVGNYQLSRKDGEWRLSVEAREPSREYK